MVAFYPQPVSHIHVALVLPLPNESGQFCYCILSILCLFDVTATVGHADDVGGTPKSLLADEEREIN